MVKKVLTININWSGQNAYPKLQVQGKWLEALGFGIGKSYSLEGKPGEIVLKLLEDSKTKK